MTTNTMCSLPRVSMPLTMSLGIQQRSQLSKLPFQKHLVGTLALMVLGFNFTKRYMTFPHHHKDDSQPMLILNGELHPFEHLINALLQEHPDRADAAVLRRRTAVRVDGVADAVQIEGGEF